MPIPAVRTFAMRRRLDCRRIAPALLALVATSSWAWAEPAKTCTLEEGPTRSVVRVVDAESLLLDDGTELRLAGIVAPRAIDTRGEAVYWPPEHAAVEALSALVLGRSVELAYPARRTDRHGRVVGHAFIVVDGQRIWVQGKLASEGHARAAAPPGGASCLKELMAHEALARMPPVGIWSNATYRVRRATEIHELMRFRNTFQIVSGAVAKVATTRGHTYLNFGSDWRTDFTVGIPARMVSSTPGLAETLKTLEGRQVTVRGWLERRNGPYLDLTDPAALEIASGDETAAASEGRSGAGRRNAPAVRDALPGNAERPAQSPAPDARDL